MPRDASDNESEKLRQSFENVADHSRQLWQHFLDHQPPRVADPFNIGGAFLEMGVRMFNDPNYLIQAQQDFWQSWMSLWQGNSHSAKDRRFADLAWHDHFVFSYIRQSYLMFSGWLLRTIHGVEGMDTASARKVDFHTRQFVDAMSPSNFLLTNPEVIRETVASKGQNLVRGFGNLLEDLKRAPGHFSISMTDRSAFQVGKNIALSEGKVVFENDLIQLIHYTPRRKKIYSRPLLIVPPWINRYYILDLNAEKSFVRFALDQGLDVFMISWVNPDGSLRDKTLGDYMREGPLAGRDVVRRITGEKDIHMLGYCIGGTLLAAALACIERRAEHRPASATFLATLVDFTDPGPIANLIDEPQVQALEERMHEEGCLAGEDMAFAFNMLRSNDLIWSFVVHNYLMGKDPLPFDLLYWNSDSTRMPEAMHSFYLRKMYLENRMIEKDGIELDGTKIDLTRVRSPCYFIATRHDHIAPWESVFAGLRCFRHSKKRFVLSGSGHVAGIINPAQSGKYGYWTGGDPEGSAKAWFEAAQSHPGSWWKDWAQWVSALSGQKIDPRTPGTCPDHPAIEDAPGRYVRH